MMKPSLVAAQERDAKRKKLGNTLQVLDRHVDFAALAAKVDRVAPRPGRSRGGRLPSPTKAASEGHRGGLDQKIRQVLLWLQAGGQRGQAL